MMMRWMILGQRRITLSILMWIFLSHEGVWFSNQLLEEDLYSSPRVLQMAPWNSVQWISVLQTIPVRWLGGLWHPAGCVEPDSSTHATCLWLSCTGWMSGTNIYSWWAPQEWHHQTSLYSGAGADTAGVDRGELINWLRIEMTFLDHWKTLLQANL